VVLVITKSKVYTTLLLPWIVCAKIVGDFKI